MKGIKSKIKEDKKKRINMKAIIPTHITVKMLKTEDKILNVYCESKTKNINRSLVRHNASQKTMA